MSKTIGYFEGSNPEWLTTLVAMGHNTIPVSNGYDGHGKNVRLFNAKSHEDVVIGYLHKVATPVDWEATTMDILHGCFTYDIPVLLAVPGEYHAAALEVLGDCGSKVELIDPLNMVTAIKAKL